MSKSNTTSRIRVAVSTVLFVFFLFLTYFATVTIIASHESLYSYTPNIAISEGSRSFTLDRYLEFENIEKDFDVIFMGSSVSMFSFNTDIFTKNGIKSYNLASNGQLPLNIYHTANRYLDEKIADTVIIDAYWQPLAVQDRDSTEAATDFFSNTTPSWDSLDLALDVNNLVAYNTFFATLGGELIDPLGASKQKIISYREYVGSGFFKTNEINEPGKKFDLVGPLLYEPDQKQFEYLEKLIKKFQNLGVEVILLNPPLTDEFFSEDRDFDAVNEELSELVNKYKLRYIDFNQLRHAKNLNLNTLDHYKDSVHLNYTGSGIFSQYVIDTLELAN